MGTISIAEDTTYLPVAENILSVESRTLYTGSGILLRMYTCSRGNYWHSSELCITWYARAYLRLLTQGEYSHRHNGLARDRSHMGSENAENDEVKMPRMKAFSFLLL